MKLTVNIEKKYFFGLLAVILVVAGIFAVYATWNPAKTVWHNADDVKVNIGGVDYSLQEAIDNRLVLNRFPVPDYDSGWVNFSSGTVQGPWTQTREKTIIHNLGTTETIVFVEANNSNFGRTGGTDNFFFGVEDTSGDNQYGFTWRNKNSQAITLVIGDNENVNNIKLRVRMWKTN